MRVNEIAKMMNFINNLASDDNVFSSTKITNTYAQQITNYANTIKSYSDLSNKISSFAGAVGSLSTNVNFLNNINTSYKDPVTGQTVTSTQTLDAIQVSRLKSQLSNFVETYNNALQESNNVNNTAITNEFNEIEITENLENLGITRNEDGTLSFNETTFNQNIVAGQTKIADIQDTLSDLNTLTSSATTMISNISNEIQTEYTEMNNQIAQLQSEFYSQYQEFLESNLNTLLTNTINSLLSSLGIGSKFDNFA